MLFIFILLLSEFCEFSFILTRELEMLFSNFKIDLSFDDEAVARVAEGTKELGKLEVVAGTIAVAGFGGADGAVPMG